MKAAIFSNGFTDHYKGSRDVMAAWMVTENESGRVVASGHSLSRAHAEKTARGAVPRVRTLPSGWAKLRDSVHIHSYARRHGFDGPDEMAANYAMLNAQHARNFSIEVIDL